MRSGGGPRLVAMIVLLHLIVQSVPVAARYPFSDFCPRGYPTRLETSVGGTFYATVEVNQSDVESLSHILLLEFDPLGFSKSAPLLLTWERNGVLPTLDSPLLTPAESSTNTFKDTTFFPFVLRNLTSVSSVTDVSDFATNNTDPSENVISGYGAGVYMFGGKVVACPSCIAQRFDVVFTPRLFVYDSAALQVKTKALLDEVIVPSSEMPLSSRLALIQALYDTGTEQPFWVVPDRYTSSYYTQNNTASSPSASVYLPVEDAPNIGLYFWLQALNLQVAHRQQVIRLRFQNIDNPDLTHLEPKKPLLNTWLSTQPVFLTPGQWLVTPFCASSDVTYADEFAAYLDQAAAASFQHLKQLNISVNPTNHSALLTPAQLKGLTFRPKQTACDFRFAVGVNDPPPAPSSASPSFGNEGLRFSSAVLLSFLSSLTVFLWTPSLF